MAALYDAMEELREMSHGTDDRCEHPRAMHGLTEDGISLRHICDPARGGCGADMGALGGEG